jgi:hypothetical protein
MECSQLEDLTFKVLESRIVAMLTIDANLREGLLPCLRLMQSKVLRKLVFREFLGSENFTEKQSQVVSKQVSIFGKLSFSKCLSLETQPRQDPSLRDSKLTKILEQQVAGQNSNTASG